MFVHYLLLNFTLSNWSRNAQSNARERERFLFSKKTYLYTNQTKKDMPVSGVVTQSAALSPLTFTDTSTGISVTSRILTVSDSNGTVVGTYDMGASLTQLVTITKDVYYTFLLTLNTNQTATINYLSTRQYDLHALTLEQALDCDCRSAKSLCNDAIKALMAKQWAITYLLFGQGANSQRCINAANSLIASASNCNC